MAEKIISPGVFTKEIDASFLPAAIGEIGACVIGPTVKGPAMIPTVVSSYSEFQAKFGDVIQSGSNYYTYLTSVTAQEYLNHSGKITVVSIKDGNYSQASAQVGGAVSSTSAAEAKGSIIISKIPTGSIDASLETDEISIGTVDFTFVSSSAVFENTANQIFVELKNKTIDQLGEHLSNAIGSLSSSVHGLSLTSSYDAATNRLNITGSGAGSTGNLTIATGSGGVDSAMQLVSLTGGSDASSTGQSFTLKTHDAGSIMNNSSSLGQTNNILLSGSKNNVRWEISNKNNNKGTFTLLIRKGNDTSKQKQILETWNNLSLDSNQSNYIGKMIGDSTANVVDSGTSDLFIQMSGSYVNKSKYVYATGMLKTVDYLDENGNVRIPAASASLPAVGSGSYEGSFNDGDDGYGGFDSLGNAQHNFTGSDVAPINFYGDINSTNSQGYPLSSTTTEDGGTAYMDALNLISNADEYDINLILIPGIVDSIGAGHAGIVTKAIDVAEARGDCFVIYDSVDYNTTNISTVTGQASNRDSNYAATYWPWVQVSDLQTGTYNWVPPSTVMAGIYAFNDKVAAPWFAPAGLNRGGLDNVIQAARKLTHANRDTLYESNVNPIATFPGQGVVVWGQKTLQKKSSALDRINVRRLLIKVKKFIAASSRFLVFEQNNAQTRERFLNIANPYLEQVQAQSGLNAFKVVMDETNNTPDIVDRNILYGQIFLQPTRTAEFIVLDFSIQPTGAAFPE